MAAVLPTSPLLGLEDAGAQDRLFGGGAQINEEHLVVALIVLIESFGGLPERGRLAESWLTDEHEARFLIDVCV